MIIIGKDIIQWVETMDINGLIFWKHVPYIVEFPWLSPVFTIKNICSKNLSLPCGDGSNMDMKRLLELSTSNKTITTHDHAWHICVAIYQWFPRISAKHASYPIHFSRDSSHRRCSRRKFTRFWMFLGQKFRPDLLVNEVLVCFVQVWPSIY